MIEDVFMICFTINIPTIITTYTNISIVNEHSDILQNKELHYGSCWLWSSPLPAPTPFPMFKSILIF